MNRLQVGASDFRGQAVRAHAAQRERLAAICDKRGPAARVPALDLWGREVEASARDEIARCDRAIRDVEVQSPSP